MSAPIPLLRSDQLAGRRGNIRVYGFGNGSKKKKAAPSTTLSPAGIVKRKNVETKGYTLRHGGELHITIYS